MIDVLAAFIGNMVNDYFATPIIELQQSVNRASTERQQSVNRASTERQHSVNRESTERQWFWVLHLVWSKGYAMAITRNRSIGRLYMYYPSYQCRYTSKWVSTEHQQSVNDFGCGILYNPWAMLRLLPIINILAAVGGNMVNVAVATPKNERQQSVNRAWTERQPSIKRASTEHQWFWVLHIV